MIWPPAKLFITAICITFCAGFPFYHAVVINPAEDVFKRFLNESYNKTYNGVMTDTTFSIVWGIMIAMLNLGALLGVSIGPWLNERVGRKGTLLVNNIPSLIGTLLICVARKVDSIELLAIGRFIVGINSGIAAGVCGLYLHEISPAEVRGIMGSIQESAFCFVCTLAMILGIPELLGTDDNIYILVALPLIVIGFHSIHLLFVPETPKHLLLTKLDEIAADKSLQFYHGANVNLAEVKKELRREKELQTGESMSLWECLTDPNIRKGFLIGVTANFAAVLTGITAVFFFSTDIFNKAGVPLNVAKYSTVGMTILNSLSTVLSSTLLVERFGRRPLMLISLTGCLLCHITFVIFSELYQNLGWKWAPYIGVSALIFHVMVYSIGAGPLVWFLTAELVPQAARSKAQAFAAGSQWTGAIVDGIAFYPLFYAIGPYALLVTSVVPTSILTTILYFHMPESKDKDVNTIFAEYNAKREEKSSSTVETTLSKPSNKD